MSPKIKSEQIEERSSEEIMPAAEEMVAPGEEGVAAAAKPKSPWLFIVIAIVVLAGIGLIFKDKIKSGLEGRNQAISGYQAVFLSNGQVYFGKLSDAKDTYVTLRDIYYLQVVQQQQQLQGQQAAPGQQPQVSLVKLGNELHGPADVMKINRSQILFYEDLKTDSQVVKAIKDYVQKPAPEAPQVQTQPAPAPQPQPQPTEPAPTPTGTPAK